MNHRYTVVGDGKGGAKLRAEANLKSADAGEAPIGAEVRIDKMQELATGEKLRAHICESRGKRQVPVGWTTAMLLSCFSKQCGRCHGCGTQKVLPSHKYKPVTICIDFTEAGKGFGLMLEQGTGYESNLVKINKVLNEEIKGWAHPDMHIAKVGDTSTDGLSKDEVMNLLKA